MSVVSPHIVQHTVPVLENVGIARDTYRLRFVCEPLAAAIRPGQFLMLRLPGTTDPLLGRAYALYDTVARDNQPWAVDIVYLVVGKLTRLLAELDPGDFVIAWGPLGNGFPDYTGIQQLALIAGGIGQTPFLALAKRVLGLKGYGGTKPQREVERVSFFHGVRRQDYLGGLDDFVAVGCDVHVATDDGSQGFHGLVTQLADQQLSREAVPGQRWAGCGPEPMLHALAKLAQKRGVPCDLSLETPMACGVGICFSCVTKVACAEGWDYRRVCVDGPVFEARQLVW